MFLNELNGVIVENLHTSAYIHLSRHCSLFCGLVIHFKCKQPDSFLLCSHCTSIDSIQSSSIIRCFFFTRRNLMAKWRTTFFAAGGQMFYIFDFQVRTTQQKVLLLIRCRTHHERMFELIKSLQKQNLFQNIFVFIWYSECIFEKQWFVS